MFQFNHKVRGVHMIKVLILDDEPFIREGLKVIVDWERYGYEIVAEAGNGMDAIRQLETSSADLAFVDLKMPGMSGLEFIQYVQKNISNSMRFVILTGYADFKYAQTAVRLGVNDYMLKPIQPAELIKRLEQMNLEYLEENRRKQADLNLHRLEYDKHMANVLHGKYSMEDINFVEEKLQPSRHLQYVSFELDENLEGFCKLSEEEKLKLQERCMEIMERLMNNPYYVVPIMEREEHVYGVGLLFTTTLPDKENQKSMEYLLWLKQEVDLGIKHPVQVYIGSTEKSLMTISRSFQSIRITRCLHNFSEEKKPVTLYEELECRTAASAIMYSEIDDLVECVKHHDKEGIHLAVKRFYRGIWNNAMNLDMIYANTYNLLYRLIELAKEADDEMEQDEVIKYISNESFGKIILSGSVNEVSHFITEYSDYLRQLKSGGAKDILNMVEKYVQENYTENLSLKYLGETFFVNNVYLGQLFKKKFGVAFKEYLNDIRIREAIRLLEVTNLRIYAIAEKVGFQNVNYFINKFVQKTGVTPNQYRTGCREEKAYVETKQE